MEILDGMTADLEIGRSPNSGKMFRIRPLSSLALRFVAYA